jgi:hypothetical protein
VNRRSSCPRPGIAAVKSSTAIRPYFVEIVIPVVILIFVPAEVIWIF